MIGRCSLAGLIAALLLIFLPSITLAQDFSFAVSPTEVQIIGLRPGETAEFELTIRNKDEVSHIFALTTFHPPEEERREGRAEFPDAGWISFAPLEIEVPANHEASVTVTVAIPQGQEWAGYDWEIWLGVAAESGDLLAVKVYTRLLVSTGASPLSHLALAAWIVVGTMLLGCGGYYYFRRRARPG